MPEFQEYRYDPESAYSEYIMPSIDVLPPSTTGRISSEAIEDGKKRIKWVFESHGISVKGINVNVGPRISLYEVDIDVRNAGRIIRHEKELLSSLSPNGSRIINLLPDKLAVGVELPNCDNTNRLVLKDVFDNDRFRHCTHELPVAFGIDTAGNSIIRDLAKMPHLLICGEMQQGKTSLIRQTVASLLLKTHPSRVKFTIIDPCSLDLQQFNRLDSYLTARLPNNASENVTDNSSRAIEILNSLVLEIENRRILFQDASARSIMEYNDLFCHRQLNPAKGHRFMPYIVVICDEFSSLSSEDPKYFNALISALLPKAASAGIHCIFSTKYISSEILTHAVRANFPVKAAFRIDLPNESRLVIGSNAATRLLPDGDIILAGNGDLSRVQSAKCDTEDIEPIIDAVNRSHCHGSYYTLPDTVIEMTTTNSPTRDPLFEDCARFVVSSGLASSSAIQRHFCIGYNRASKILDEMETAGIVGSYSGFTSRNILMTPDDLDKILQ